MQSPSGSTWTHTCSWSARATESLVDKNAPAKTAGDNNNLRPVLLCIRVMPIDQPALNRAEPNCFHVTGNTSISRRVGSSLSHRPTDPQTHGAPRPRPRYGLGSVIARESGKDEAVNCRLRCRVQVADLEQPTPIRLQSDWSPATTSGPSSRQQSSTSSESPPPPNPHRETPPLLFAPLRGPRTPAPTGVVPAVSRF